MLTACSEWCSASPKWRLCSTCLLNAALGSSSLESSATPACLESPLVLNNWSLKYAIVSAYGVSEHGHAQFLNASWSSPFWRTLWWKLGCISSRTLLVLCFPLLHLVLGSKRNRPLKKSGQCLVLHWNITITTVAAHAIMPMVTSLIFHCFAITPFWLLTQAVVVTTPFCSVGNVPPKNIQHRIYVWISLH